MRKIDKIIIHCSATPIGRDFSAKVIREWHVKGNGWDDIGYHYIVRLNGDLEYGRPVEIAGAHCRGHNKNSIGICYIGGMDSDMKKWEDTRTESQSNSLLSLLTSFSALIYCNSPFCFPNPLIMPCKLSG